MLLLACREATEDGSDDPIDFAQSGSIDDIVYLPDQISFSVPHMVWRLWVEDERIFYYYFDMDDQNTVHLVLTYMNLDGTEIQNVEIPVTPGSLLGIDISGGEYIEVVSSVLDGGVLYSKYDLQGQELARHFFEGLALDNISGYQVEDVLFTDCGKILAAVSESRESTVYILDIENSSLEEMTFHERATEIIRLNDGRVIVGFFSFNESIFREIDISNATIERTYRTSFVSGKMFPAEAESTFDILLSTGGNLSGYRLAADELLPVLNWIEAGVALDSVSDIGVLPDSRVFVYTVSMINSERYDVNLFILTPVLREDVPDKATLTLGGFYISDKMRRAVVEFNLENEGFQIAIHDYWDEVDGDWYAALLRFRTQIVTGRGPDIIYQPSAALSDGGFLLDLYPFIDADRELSRADFFPNALKLYESSDGSLTTVADSFAIWTMAGLTDVVGHIRQDSWTPQSMLELLKDNEEMFAPFGQWVDRVDFIRRTLQFSGDELINWSSREAYLDSAEFIDILAIAAFLPSSEEIMDAFQGEYVSDWDKLMLREKLVLDLRLWHPIGYQEVANAGDFYILGVPTFEGGKNIIYPGEGILGINASSEYPDEAWLFLRQSLVYLFEPEDVAITDIGVEVRQRQRSFPIRIDMYNDLIDFEMTQIVDEEGEDVPHGWVWMNYDVPIYAMTQNEADSLHMIVESAIPQSRRIEDELWVHLEDDLNVFFAGHRTANDTARIMQNRVQTHLNE